MEIDMVALSLLLPSMFGLTGQTPLVELPKVLLSKGLNIKVFCLRYGSTFEKIRGVEVYRNIPWYRTQSNNKIIRGINNLATSGTQLHLLIHSIKSKADLLHIRINPLPFLFKGTARKRTVYNVSNIHTHQLDEFHKYSTSTFPISKPLKIERIAEVKAYEKADMIVAITGLMKDVIIEEFNVEKDRVKIIPDGVNTILFKPNSLPPKEPVIVYEGSIAPFRGIETLFQSLVIVKERVKNARLLIVGGCPQSYYHELLKRIHRMNFSNGEIIFTGFIPYERVPKWLSRAQVGVSPLPPLQTFRMSAPMKVLEYMAMSIPVVATEEIPFHRETIGNRCGILVKSRPEEIAKGIIQLLEDRTAAIRMGKTGRGIVESRFTWKQIANRFEQVYLQAME